MSTTAPGGRGDGGLGEPSYSWPRSPRVPRVPLLDEKSLGLAPVIVDDIFEVVLDIRQSGTSVLLVEQNVVEALEAADRAYILGEGRIVREGLPDDLLAGEQLRSAYLETDHGE